MMQVNVQCENELLNERFIIINLSMSYTSTPIQCRTYVILWKLYTDHSCHLSTVHGTERQANKKQKPTLFGPT